VSGITSNTQALVTGMVAGFAMDMLRPSFTVACPIDEAGNYENRVELRREGEPTIIITITEEEQDDHD
jgi:hypothetical protein